MHTQMNAVFNDFYGGIKVYHLSLGYRNEKLNTNFSWGLNYFSYGNISKRMHPEIYWVSSGRPIG